jgi:transposase
MDWSHLHARDVTRPTAYLVSVRRFESSVHGLITATRESDSILRVSDTVSQLPVDIDAPRALLVAARSERDAPIAERDQVLSQNDRLRHLLRQLQRAQFGRRSKKLDPEQLRLAPEDIEHAIAANEADEDKKNPAAAEARTEKRRANRGALPAHLPRVGEHTSQRLDVIPVQFRVLVTHRPKYACRACAEAVVQAPAPDRLIKGGLPIEGSRQWWRIYWSPKYAWHLPLHRQAQMLAGKASTLSVRSWRSGSAMQPPSYPQAYFTGVLTKLVNLAGLAHRRAHAMGLSAGARDKPSSGVTPNSG